MSAYTDKELEHVIAEAIDDSVLKHTGRSIGDVASGKVAHDLIAVFPDDVQLRKDNDFIKALKQELKQSLEAKSHEYTIVHSGSLQNPTYRKIEAVRMEAIDEVFQDKGDNHE